jgi:hypothetical protein
MPVDCARTLSGYPNTAELWRDSEGCGTQGRSDLLCCPQRKERPIREVGFLTEIQTGHHRNAHQHHYRFTQLP